MTGMRRGWFHLASGAGIGRAFGFFSNLLLSRWLGPAELGLFNLVTTTVQTSDTLVRCGGDYALNFELGGQPEATQSEGGVQLARGLAQICSLTTLVICVGLAVWIWWGQGLFPTSLPVSHRFILTGLLLLMIAFEGSSASAWEVLLVSHRTIPFATRQGLFAPLRLCFAAGAALYWGISGAMLGWIFIAFVQTVYLRSVLGTLWNPLHLWPLYFTSILVLLKRGSSFFASNLVASIIFYPLLLRVAAGSGLSEIGYLRIGQILQQLFAFLPATLVPVLFLKLREEPKLEEQIGLMEKPLRVIWIFLLEILLLYCTLDHFLITLLFGISFRSALLPTRLLLLTALFECLSQLVVQPLLAAGKTRLYAFWQNGAALFAAVIGWLWIPSAGLAAYLIVRLFYVLIPLIGFGIPVFLKMRDPRRVLSLILVSSSLLVLFLVQTICNYTPEWMSLVYFALLLVIPLFHRQDLFLLQRLLRRV